jgi:hypothetical protein
MKALIRRIITAGVAGAAFLGLVSCGDVARFGRSPSILVVDSLIAASGATPDQLGVPLLSDVQVMVEQTVGGTPQLVPTFFNDVGEATLRIILKDPGALGAEANPTALNAVTITRYRVVYRRTDGRNTPGVDVPYPFDGGVTATITESPSGIAFEIVRHQAKLEQPLRAMVGLGGRMFISTLADVTFYGRDLAGNDVQATGTINVNFSDFADPD